VGGWYGMGCCYFRPHLQEHSEEERLKKENQEKKEKQRKISPGDPGYPEGIPCVEGTPT